MRPEALVAPSAGWLRALVPDRPRWQRQVLLVSDRAGWIIQDVARNLCRHLPAAMRPTVVTKGWRRSRQCLVHFIDRPWAWSDDALDGMHTSNRLIGLWWHGRFDSGEPAIQAGLKRLRRLWQRFVRIQVTCSSARRTMLELGIPAERIIVLPEGVDGQRFSPAPSSEERERVRHILQIPKDAITIGCFQKDGQGWGDGREPKLIKGPDVFAEVLGRLRRSYPVHAVIPGPARGYVKERLTALDVPLAAPGVVPYDRWPSIYHALDLYLCPSRDEGGPAGVLESMASGIPVVSTRVGMSEDIILDRFNGRLAEIGGVAQLVSALEELMADPSARQRYAHAALATIRTYDWRVLGPRYAEILYCPLLAAEYRDAELAA